MTPLSQASIPRVLLLAWLTLDTENIYNYIHYKVWDVITYPLPIFNGVDFKVATIAVWVWIGDFILHYSEHLITYPRWN